MVEFTGDHREVLDRMPNEGYKEEHFNGMAKPGEIDYTALASIPDEKVRMLACSRQVKAARYVSLSDALVSRLIGGNHVLVYLEREESQGLPNQGGDIEIAGATKKVRTWKIKCLRDSWGDPVSPGDKVRWLVNRRNRDDLGLKLRSSDIKDMKRRGTAHLLETHHTAVVDSKGCIELPYSDAGMLLDNWGVHYASNEPISGYRDKSTAQKKHPVTGDLKHRYNWRYMEIPPEMYADLPDLTEPEKPKRKTRSDKGTKKAPIEDTAGISVNTGREPVVEPVE